MPTASSPTFEPTSLRNETCPVYRRNLQGQTILFDRTTQPERKTDLFTFQSIKCPREPCVLTFGARDHDISTLCDITSDWGDSSSR